MIKVKQIYGQKFKEKDKDNLIEGRRFWWRKTKLKQRREGKKNTWKLGQSLN